MNELDGSLIVGQSRRIALACALVAHTAIGFACSSSGDPGAGADGGGGGDGGPALDSGRNGPDANGGNDASNAGNDASSNGDASSATDADDGSTFNGPPPANGKAFGTCVINNPTSDYNGLTTVMSVTPDAGTSVVVQNGSGAGQTTGVAFTVTSPDVRICNVYVNGPVAVGTYRPGLGGPGTAGFTYGEQGGRSWAQQGPDAGGTVTVDSVNGKTYTYTVHNVPMLRTGSGAAGTFELGGSGIATMP